MALPPSPYEIRRGAERGRMRTDWLDARFSFAFADYAPPGREHFGALRVLNEDFIRPASGFGMHPHRDMEILLMPLRSAVQHEDSLGNRLDVQPGELLVMHAGRGIWHSQMNASPEQEDHHLQLWLLPRRQDAEPGIAWRAFAEAGREGRWQLWASGHGEPEALAIDAEARVLRARLPAGQGLASPLAAGRRLYLHVVSGAVRLRPATRDTEELLQAGDALAWPRGAAFELEAAPDAPADLLLFDLGED